MEASCAEKCIGELFAKLDYLKRARKMCFRAFARFEFLGVFWRCFGVLDNPKAAKFLRAFEALVHAARDPKQRVETSAIEELEAAAEDVHDAHIAARGIVDEDLFKMFTKALVKLYGKNDAMVAEYFKKNEDYAVMAKYYMSIKDMEEEVKKQCTDRVWKSFVRAYPGPPMLAKEGLYKHRYAKSSGNVLRSRPMIVHQCLLETPHTVMGQFSVYEGSVFVPHDGLEMFLDLNEKLFREAMVSIQQKSLFEVDKMKPLFELVCFVFNHKDVLDPEPLAQLNTLRLLETYQTHLSDVKNFEKMFETLCAIFKSCNRASRMCIFDKTVGKIKRMFSSNMAVKTPYTLYFYALKFVFYWTEIIKADKMQILTLDMAKQLNGDITPEVEYYKMLLKSSSVTKTERWIRKTTEKLLASKNDLMAKKARSGCEEGVKYMVRKMFSELIMMQVDQQEVPEWPEAVQLDVIDLKYLHSSFRWALVFGACSLVLKNHDSKKNEAFLNEMSNKMVVPFMKKAKNESNGDLVLKVFLNDYEGRPLKYGVQQFGLSSHIVVGTDMHACKKTKEIASALLREEGCAELFEREFSVKLQELYPKLVMVWEEPSQPGLLVDRQRVDQLLRCMARRYNDIVSLNFRVHWPLYKDMIQKTMAQLYKE